MTVKYVIAIFFIHLPAHAAIENTVSTTERTVRKKIYVAWLQLTERRLEHSEGANDQETDNSVALGYRVGKDKKAALHLVTTHQYDFRQDKEVHQFGDSYLRYKDKSLNNFWPDVDLQFDNKLYAPISERSKE